MICKHKWFFVGVFEKGWAVFACPNCEKLKAIDIWKVFE